MSQRFHLDHFSVLFELLLKELAIRLLITKKGIKEVNKINVSSHCNNNNSFNTSRTCICLTKIFAAILSKLFKHVQGTIKWLTILAVLVKGARLSMCLRLLVL